MGIQLRSAKNIHSIAVSADLFQSSSVLDYSCNPQCLPIQHPQSLAILTHLEASKHPGIQASLTAGIPYSIILKGTQFWAAGRPRGPQGISRRQTLCPPTPPLALKLVLPPARECQMAYLTGIRASRHPGIQASMPQVPEVGGRGGSL